MSEDTPVPHRRRPRYAGKNPRRFEEKYKEREAAKYPETVAKVLASGKTPAGSHRPIMVTEILEVLGPKPGMVAVDCTLGYGGHAEAMLRGIQPGGRLIALDLDPLEIVKTEARLRVLGYGPEVLSVHRSNFAGLSKFLAAEAPSGADVILADLGVSSMQIDDPARGFSVKHDGPLDMRMNPQRGEPAGALLRKVDAHKLADILRENADEPHADTLAAALAGREFAGTAALRRAIVAAFRAHDDDERDQAVRRVFQALRIAVNDEFSALDSFLRQLPRCLAPGGRAAILTFHSGEDRRVKKAFAAGVQSSEYVEVAREVIRAGTEERLENPRSTSAKLRWAVRTIGTARGCG